MSAAAPTRKTTRLARDGNLFLSYCLRIAQKAVRSGLAIVLGVSACATSGLAQKIAPPSTTPASGSPSLAISDSPIAPGDIVDVQVFDAPELSVRSQVSHSGDIPMPLLSSFHIAGMTSAQAGTAIAAALVNRGFVRDPKVLVTVQQYGNGVTVLGEVRGPGMYPIIGQGRMVDLLTMAGGLTPTAGHLIEITGTNPNQPKQGIMWDPTLQDNKSADFLLSPGDTVLVSRCGVAYVGGNVGRPGGFPICDSAHMTVAQIVAVAQGVKASTSYKNTILIRNVGGTRVVREIRLDQILKGTAPDITLEADDIIYVAPSAVKAAIKRTIDIAIAFVSTAAIYLQ